LLHRRDGKAISGRATSQRRSGITFQASRLQGRGRDQELGVLADLQNCQPFRPGIATSVLEVYEIFDIYELIKICHC